MNPDKPIRIQRCAATLHVPVKKLIGELLLAGYPADAMGDIFSKGLELAMASAMNEIADAVAKHRQQIEGN